MKLYEMVKEESYIHIYEHNDLLHSFYDCELFISNLKQSINTKNKERIIKKINQAKNLKM